MKKILVSIIVITLMLILPTAAIIDVGTVASTENQPSLLQPGVFDISDAGGSGTDVSTIQAMSRTITGLSMNILNTYNNPLHQELVSLSSYQIAGWTLYGAEVDANSIIATAERKTLTINPADYISILNNSGLVTDALYQQFYGQPYDGKLENYTFAYQANPYDASLGDAYLVVRSNYSDKQTNVTGWITPFTQRLSFTAVTHNCASDGAILNASTFYYVVIDGTGMTGQYVFPPGTWVFNTIYWRAQYPYLGLQTGYHLRGVAPPNDWDVYDSGQQREAELNYTYTPWNKTSNAALTFAGAEQISLKGNGTSLSGTSWVFSSSNDIGLISFQSNQSIVIDYDLTLLYKKDGTGSTTWYVANSGASAEWNVSLSLEYPEMSGTIIKFVNVSIQPDWFPTGLYNGTSIDYGHYTKSGSTVSCTDMTNGSWTLTSTAPNYVTDIALSDHSNSNTINASVNILVDMDIDANISNGVTGGTTNLTILHGLSTIYAPAEIPASQPLTNFLWNIDATTSGNGTHSIEVHWTNGQEAGYFTKQIFIYYPTDLTAQSYSINGFTESNVNIGVYFEDAYVHQGLHGTGVSVAYSFDGESNVSLTDQNNGTWTASVSTAGRTNSSHSITVYAEGYAFENRSIAIAVNLVVETLALNWSWSNGNNITYLQSTNLTISYREIGGTSISNAKVNVTFDGNTYDLFWDSISGNYWIQLNGSDFITIPGTTILIVNAWKLGYAAQYNDSIQITINEVTGVVFNVVWDPADRNITFIEQITITATYMYNSNPIDDTWLGVWVRAYFTGHPGYVNFTYNSGLEVWQLTVDGSDYLGATSVTIQANATGYSTDPIIDTMTVVKDIPSLTSSWSGSAYTTDYATVAPVTFTVQDSIGSAISDANLTVTINGTKTTYSPGEYLIYISPPQIAGVYQVNVTMVRYGFTTTSIFLTLTVRATTDFDIIELAESEYEQWNLTVKVTYTDHVNSSRLIANPVVTMTLDGVDYTLQYVAGEFTIEILLDVAPDNYTLSFNAAAPLANTQTASRLLTVKAKDAVHIELISEGNPNIEGQAVVLTATLLKNGTGQLVGNRDIFFVITIHFVNGSTLVLDSLSQNDTTNAGGVATFSFQVPAGTIESIQAEAYFPQSRDLWGARRAITVTAGPNPLFVLLYFFFVDSVGRLVTISMIVLGVVATAYNRRVKPKKRLAMASLDNQLQMFVDLESLRHFMAVYLDRGTCVFYHPFTDERIQPDLISGFIAAITSVYGEIKGDGVRGTLEEIQYHGLRLNSYSGEKIIGILILEGEITPLIKDRLQFFVELFENQYEKDLEGWTGLVDCFDTEWIVSTLNSAFNYSWLLPHRIGQTQKVSKTDAKILDYITAVRDERGEFYIRKLLSPLAEMLGMTEAQVLDRLLTLHDRNVIVPVTVQTVIQRQGMGLSEDQESKDVTVIDQIPMPKEEVEEKPAPKEKKKPEKGVEEPTSAPEPEEQVVEPTPKAKMKPQKFVEEPTQAPAPEKQAEKPLPKSESEKKEDEMEAFVKHVESLLAAEAKKKREAEKEKKE